MRISEATRRDIFDTISIMGIHWSGTLDEHAFLLRIFPVKEMTSYDIRFNNAYEDIWQHRVNNPGDWPDDWLFDDDRFDLLRVEDTLFLQFLCEMLHPRVQPDEELVSRVYSVLNDHLKRDGFELVEKKRIAGRPVFEGRHINASVSGTVEMIREAFQGTDANYVDRQIKRMETAINDDPELAIGTAKELVETCCKAILDERGEIIDGKPDLPKLVKQTSKVLALTREDIADEAKAADTIRNILSNLSSVVQGLAELRNQYGTGHGKKATHRGLQPRHAKLAVGAASTLATFLVETHKVRPAKKHSDAI